MWSIDTSEKLSFHDNADDDVVIYCSQVFSDERLVTVGPSTDSTQPGQLMMMMMTRTVFMVLSHYECSVGDVMMQTVPCSC